MFETKHVHQITQPKIFEVWSYNLKEELDKIADLIEDYRIIAMVITY